ncbi:DUF6089 family protein [Compostibacter hankyongensis]|uniref:type IX secretion system protein PorG n=1 Tax=Compostibacter hankyongensis TaxID=1007089 RepID=UPI0031EAEB80
MQLFRPAGIFLLLLLTAPCAWGQGYIDYNTHYIAEAGFELGGAQYFGDLNTRTAFKTLKPTLGAFYRRYLNDYIGVSAHLHYARLGYSDTYNDNAFQHRRNLSFNSDIWELTLQGDFNFYRFEPGSLRYRFTPYLTLGIGGFHFNPYTWYQDKKYYLQPLGTEGQGSAQYPDRKPYNLYTYCIPVGMGLKYNINNTTNISFVVTHRFTGTDYLDDVSTTYAGASAFPAGSAGKESIPFLLQDRSWATGSAPIGQQGRQRGNSRDRDQYLMVEVNISWMFAAYRCPAF